MNYRLSPFPIALIFVLGSSWGMAIADDNPRPEEVAPGVWRFHFGDPEKLTPLTFRFAPPQLKGLNELPQTTLPIDPSQMTFYTTGRGCAVELPMAPDERIYGFGLNTTLFEMTEVVPKVEKGVIPVPTHPGRHVFLRPTDSPQFDLNDSHAPVPFYLSNLGYGVYVDTARYASFYTGDVAPKAKAQGDESAASGGITTDALYKTHELKSRTMLADIPSAHGVDVYIFGGPAMDVAIRRYNLFSGGGVVPPLWGLGVAYRGFAQNNAEYTLQLAKSLRDEHLSVMSWGLEPGWQSHAYSCSFVWDPVAFPDPDGFIKKMGAMGYQINAWEHCFTHPTSPIYKALKAWSGNFLVFDGLVPDFATPQGRQIFEDQQDKSLFSKGVTSVKVDECDNQPASATPWSFPEASSFPSGLDGEQMHSLLGVLYQQTMTTALRQRNVRTWGLARNSGSLATPLPFSIYSDTYDDRSLTRAMVKEGFGGLLAVPEIHRAGSPEELYRRTEVVIFSPYALINGWMMKLPPWEQLDMAKNNAGEVMPNHAAVTAVVKELFDLRTSLIPYLYSAFNDYHLRGIPPIRALVVDWPSDHETADIDDEFMAGSSLLVAPIFKGQTDRSVYLPAGTWYDFWTHEKIEGGQKVRVSKPLDQIPIYVKDNSLLPLATPIERIASDTCFDVTVNVFGKKPANFTLYEDDGVSYDFEKGAQNQIVLSWNGQGSQAKTGGYKGPSRYRVVGWK
jgi:alpha-D-xyloside xylohydrolase